MRECEQLYLDIINDDEKQHALNVVSKLNEILKDNGIKFEFETKGKFNMLAITIDSDTVNKSMKRNAGRKAHFSNLKFSDILKMQETMTHEQIVSQLNMSRATYFRKLKQMKEMLESNADADYYF